MRLNCRVSGDGSPVLLLHGLFGQARNLATLQVRLEETHHVAAFDLRNHGMSPHEMGMTYTILAADVAETLDALGWDSCAVIGHSMGGKVAMRLALGWAARVTRLLVADIAPVAYPGTFAAYAAGMQALRLTPGLTRRQADAALVEAVPEPGVRAFLLQNLMPGAAPAWRIGLDEIAAALGDLLDWPAVEGRYAGPARFVAGARSEYLQPAHHGGIRALFPAATFAIVADAGHWLHVDNPGGFLTEVQDFLGDAPA